MWSIDRAALRRDHRGRQAQGRAESQDRAAPGRRHRAQILVRDGELVRAGQPLIVVGDVRNDAELSLLLDQLRAERIRNARATAEAALAAKFQAPADLADAPGVSDHLARERALFEARRRTLDEQVASLESQIRDSHAQAAALSKQIESTELPPSSPRKSWRSTKSWCAKASCSARGCCSCSATRRTTAAGLRKRRATWRWRGSARRAAGAHRAGAQPVSAASDGRGQGIGSARARAGRARAPVAGPGRTPVRARAGRWQGDGAARVLGRRGDRARAIRCSTSCRRRRSSSSRRASGRRTSTTCARAARPKCA